MFGNGYGCDQVVWRKVQPAFEAEHRCVLFDYVGSGGSDRSAYDFGRYGSLSGYALDVVEIGQELGLKGATFVGHSVSAMIGVLASLAAPQLFERIVLLVPSPRYLNDPPYVGGFERSDLAQLFELMDQNYLGWVTTFSDMVARDPDASRELNQAICSLDPKTAREFAEVAFVSDCRAQLPQVEAECLVVSCSDDDLVPVSVGEFVAERLPRAEYRLLSASGHLPHLTHPRETIALMRSFLEPDSDRASS